jgi:hypothetical protein
MILYLSGVLTGVLIMFGIWKYELHKVEIKFVDGIVEGE